MALVDCIDEQVHKLERGVLANFKLREEFKAFETVSGFGGILALTIALETGDIGRFAGPGNFASYARMARMARMVDSRRDSNGRNKGQGNTRRAAMAGETAEIHSAQLTLRSMGDISRHPPATTRSQELPFVET